MIHCSAEAEAASWELDSDGNTALPNGNDDNLQEENGNGGMEGYPNTDLTEVRRMNGNGSGGRSLREGRPDELMVR